MIQLKRVSTKYGATVALQPLDLSIPSAIITALLGPCGAGKSTLLRLLTGLEPPLTGSIAYHDELLTPKTLPALRRRFALLLPTGPLFPHLSARENITLAARHLHQPEDGLNKRVDELCELTRFPRPLLARYPSELSAHLLLRAALIRALLLRPTWLFLDDPMLGLDPGIRSRLLFDWKWLFKKLGLTVVWATRDFFEAAFLADEMVLLDEGRVVQQGPITELEKNPAERFVTEFIQSQRLLTHDATSPH